MSASRGPTWLKVAQEGPRGGAPVRWGRKTEIWDPFCSTFVGSGVPEDLNTREPLYMDRSTFGRGAKGAGRHEPGLIGETLPSGGASRTRFLVCEDLHTWAHGHQVGSPSGAAPASNSTAGPMISWFTPCAIRGRI